MKRLTRVVTRLYVLSKKNRVLKHAEKVWFGYMEKSKKGVTRR